MYHTKQIKSTRVITINKLIRSRIFQRGFDDVKMGRPFPETYELLHTANQWTYERGRLFGALYKEHFSLRVNRNVRQSAIVALAMACKSHDII